MITDTPEDWRFPGARHRRRTSPASLARSLRLLLSTGTSPAHRASDVEVGWPFSDVEVGVALFDQPDDEPVFPR